MQLSETLSLNKIEKMAADVTQGLSAPEFNPWYQKQRNKKQTNSN